MLPNASPSGVQYALSFVPRAWRTSLTFGTWVYQDLSGPEIVSDVLQEAGFASGTDFELRLSAQYPKREDVVQYRETDLDAAALDEADLTACDLGEASAAGATFAHTVLDDVEAAGMRAPRADFSAASLKDAVFDGAALDDTRWHEAHGAAASFGDASLAPAVFTLAALDEAEFDRAVLTAADFTEASLAEASLEGARCAGATFDRARLMALRAGAGADLTGCRARNVYAKGARLQDSLLEGRPELLQPRGGGLLQRSPRAGAAQPVRAARRQFPRRLAGRGEDHQERRDAGVLRRRPALARRPPRHQLLRRQLLGGRH